MALLKVYQFPAPILSEVSEPVTVFDTDFQTLIEDMKETMYEESGIGLAAPQIGVSQRLLVMDTEYPTLEKHSPRAIINPEIIFASEENVVSIEGCLSVPEFRAEVSRSKSIEIRYQDEEGNELEDQLEGLASICLQHELDHLNGILFIDYLPSLRRSIVKKKLIKYAKQHSAA